MGLIVLGIVRLFVDFGPIVNTVYAGLACVLFTGYIVFDTWWLLNRVSPDDFVIISVNLYLDIINLFLYFSIIVLQY